MTVRLIDLPYRKLHPTVKALSDAGFDDELAVLIRQNGGGERAVAALRREFYPESRTVITFEIAGRKYEAVSFVDAGQSVTGDEMVSRTNAENGGGLGAEDGEFLWEHRADLPEELNRHYLVFTKWRGPGGPRSVRYFDWYDGQWYQGWCGLDSQWRSHRLVLRRCM